MLQKKEALSRESEGSNFLIGSAKTLNAKGLEARRLAAGGGGVS